MSTEPSSETNERAYRLGRALGRGGSSWVWEAEAVLDGRAVVMKRLDARDGSIGRIYRSELAALGALRHPHIVELIDYGEADGALYLVLERVEGVDLERALAGGPLAPAMALALVLDAASALAHAHEARPSAPDGIVHRDVRPANLLLGRDGHAKLSDFGLARGTIGRETTASDVVRGTPGFIAPESVLGAHAGPAADVWALGAVLYTLVVGRPPIRSFEHAHAIAHGAELALDSALVGPARELVERCLVGEPGARPSAAELARCARDALGGLRAGARVALSAWVRAIGARERGTLDDLFFSSALEGAANMLVLRRPR